MLNSTKAKDAANKIKSIDADDVKSIGTMIRHEVEHIADAVKDGARQADKRFGGFVDTASDEIDKRRGQVDHLTEVLKSRAHDARSRLDDMSDDARDTFNRGRRQAEAYKAYYDDFAGDSRKAFKKGKRQAEQFARQHPAPAGLIAVGLGIILAAFLMPRRAPEPAVSSDA